MANRFQNAEKESYWRWHVDMHATSSLSIRAYCGKHGLSEASLYTWRRKIQIRDSGHECSHGSLQQSQPHRSLAQSKNRSAEAVHQKTLRAKNKRLPARSKVDLLPPSIGAGLIALDIIDTKSPTLEIEGPAGVVIRLREDVSAEVLQRVIAACQLSHSTAAVRGQEASC